MARMMGASGPVETPPSTQQTLNLRLVGTVTYHDGHGAAIVSIDGKPAKTYIVGSVLENGWVLQSVERRKASFSATAQGPVVQTLEMALPRAGN
jgi:general secretion pathway protein C